ncbi:MAG: DUF922 domain-containing protein [Ferruginibacter sp.]
MSLENFTKVLSWSNFPNPLPPGRPEEATISVTWRLDADQFERRGNAIMIGPYSVVIETVAAKCAVVKAIANGDKAVSDGLLKHEQGHYDIIALGAREFYKKLSSLSGATEDELNGKWKKMDAELSQKADIVDARYDVATNHGKNAAVQRVWNLKIEAAKNNPNGTVIDLP